MCRAMTGISLTTVLLAAGCSSPHEKGSRSATSAAAVQATSSAPAPPVYTTRGGLMEIIVVRLKQGTDLLDGLRQAVKEQGIGNAVILSGVGSLTSYNVHAVSNTTLPSTNVFYRADGPQDLLSVNGYVINGRVHAHITFSDKEKALGGHLEPGTTVFTFAIVTLGVLDKEANLERFDDWRW